MKVAIAGASNVAKYLSEEFTQYGHDVIILTRSAKSSSSQNLKQRETDYSVPSLVRVLSDRDALVSTVADYNNIPLGMEINLKMLEACKKSQTCKTFIPSEWTCNVEYHPDHPIALAALQKSLHSALKATTDVKWTIVCNSWFIEYFVPKSQRYLRDVGPAWPMDYATKTFTIYGPGTQVIDLTSARDVAKAVAALLTSTEPWEPYTYLSGDQLSWNAMFAIVRQRDAEWKAKKKPLTETIRQLIEKENHERFMVAQFEILSYSGASTFPTDKVLRQREKYFKGMKFRSIEEVLDDAAAKPDMIV